MKKQSPLQLLKDIEQLQAGVNQTSAYSRGVRDGLLWAEVLIKMKLGKEVFLVER